MEDKETSVSGNGNGGTGGIGNVGGQADKSEFASDYNNELMELTFNSKPIINNLTILAGENSSASEDIVKVIESRIAKVQYFYV